ncbi:MAG TPA: biotin-dependent carboxyltransferase family protein [Terriglobales bacterium]|nr:biotin-dependent carboxyltransferase family protein [Terriglobales bacterium]
MTEIHVKLPGLLTTVQDLGREGFGPIGVSPSGAADPVSLRLGNRLLGNPDTSAALEMTLLGGTFLFPQGAVVALTGSDFGATLDGVPVELWTSVEVSPGQILRVRDTRSGARCYLCVQGGIAVQPFLGSASTHILSGLGGFEGRALRKGDVLNNGPTEGSFRKRKLAEQARERLAPRQILRVTPGPQALWFPESSRQLFYGSRYRVTEESNRMGLRLVGPHLQGPPIPTSFAGEMVTEGVSLGAIQVPHGGLPIILFVEQQTTGGYRKIANVISADLPSLGQLRPRDEIRFELVGWEACCASRRRCWPPRS